MSRSPLDPAPEDLSRKVEEAQRILDDVCAAAGIANPDEAKRAFEERREASRHVESKGQIEKDNLRDLTYEQLERKLLGLQRGVPDYLAKRVPKPVICSDLDSAKKEWANAEEAQRTANDEWEAARQDLDAARGVREGLNTKHQEVRVPTRPAGKKPQVCAGESGEGPKERSR